MKNKFWKFENPSTWSQVPDFLAKYMEDQDHDLAEALQLEGYNSVPIIQLGTLDVGFSAEVYASEDHHGGKTAQPYKFLVSVEVDGVYEMIVIKELPDLIELLPKVSTIAEMARVGRTRE